MLGFYNYTVILTYIGMLAGFTGVVFAAEGNVRRAVLCLVIAGICDIFDGKIASTMVRTRAEKRFGVQIDSLSDLICFGVLPAMIVYASADGSTLSYLFSSLYVLAALIRLAWFNVDEEERQSREGGHREIYLGMPVTCAAIIFPIWSWLSAAFQWRTEIAGPVLLLLSAAAFLTPFRIRRANYIQFGKDGDEKSAEDAETADRPR